MEIKRKHHALTYNLESIFLDRVARLIYPYVTADQLSLLALMSALIAGLSYILSQNELSYLNLASFAIFLHWFGDSLDGRVARLRNESRPKYGHYLDHIVDSISLVLITLGISYSNLTLTSSWVWVLALFLLIMIHSFLRASVVGVFELSIDRIGPTEVRIGLILINLLTILTYNPLLEFVPFPATVLDLFGLAVALALLINFVKVVSSTLWGPKRIKEI